MLRQLSMSLFIRRFDKVLFVRIRTKKSHVNTSCGQERFFKQIKLRRYSPFDLRQTCICVCWGGRALAGTSYWRCGAHPRLKRPSCQVPRVLGPARCGCMEIAEVLMTVAIYFIEDGKVRGCFLKRDLRVRVRRETHQELGVPFA